MNTIDRIKSLCNHHGLYVNYVWLGRLHEIFDFLDDIASINTRWLDGHDGCCAANTYGLYKCRRPIGARLALHEELLAREKDGGFYFWLGIDADNYKLVA